MLRRMPAPKGRSKLAYGPCCNPTCAFAIDIQCKCGCGHERDPASVPTHHLFHPDCCTQVPNDPNLLGTEADRPAFPSKETLLSARALGADMSASHRWRTVPEELRDKRFGLQLLPAKAVLCPTCYALLWSWQERDNYEKMRERAEGIVRGHLGELPDYVISALCAVVILRFWLRGAPQRAVWQASGFRVHRTAAGATRLDTFAVPSGGGDVFKGGPARAMAVVGTLLVLYTVQLCGSGQTTTDQQNTLGWSDRRNQQLAQGQQALQCNADAVVVVAAATVTRIGDECMLLFACTICAAHTCYHPLALRATRPLSHRPVRRINPRRAATVAQIRRRNRARAQPVRINCHYPPDICDITEESAGR
eukprot:COSAG01_NODE_1074_length_11857_cov_21.092703_13_plen_364_part_00